MGTEDADALDMEQMQRQRKEDEDSSWQTFYDDSTDPPTPWWFNSMTGVSSWECPIVAGDNKEISQDEWPIGKSLYSIR